MVKKLIITLLGSLVLLSSCGDAYDVTSMIPWYVPYIKNTVNVPNLLPSQYNENDIIAMRLTGPNAMDLTSYGSYIVLVQDRQPDNPLIAVFNDNLKLLYSTTAGQVNEPNTWSIDYAGNIDFGPIQLIAPKTPGAAWSYTQYYNSSMPKVSYTDGSNTHWAAISISTTITSISAQSNYLSMAIAPPNAIATPAPLNLTPPLLSDIKTSASSGFANLDAKFSTADISSMTLSNAKIANLQTNLSSAIPKMDILITAQVNGSGYNAYLPTICFEIPLAAITNSYTLTIADIKAITFNNGNAWPWPYDDKYKTIEKVQACTFTGNGFVNCFPVNQGDSRNQVLQMFYNDSNGKLIASMNLVLPFIPTSGNNNSISTNSGLSQRPYYLSGRSEFVVIDTFHKRLALCRPWWQ